MNKCRVSIDELEHDRKTALTDADEMEIRSYRPAALRDLLEDPEYFTDRLLDAANLIHMCYSDSPIVPGEIEDMSQRNVIYMARMWSQITKQLENIDSSVIDAKAKELWEEQQ